MKLNDPTLSKELGNVILQSIKGRFREQGHVLTGKGISSLEVKVSEQLEHLTIQILGLDYMGFQDSGTKAGQRSGGGGVWINALTKWVQKRGLASKMKEAKSIAYAIATIHSRVGMHTRKKKLDLSKRHFISRGIEDKQTVIQGYLFRMFDKNFDLLLTNFTKDLEKTIIKL